MLLPVPGFSDQLVRTYLKQRNVIFSEVNVATDFKAQPEMRKTVGELSVSAVTVGSKVIQWYVPAQLSAALGHEGYPKLRASSDSTSP